MTSQRASRRAPRRARRLAIASLALAVFTLPLAAQDNGRIAGRVIDEATARPLGLAQVTIPALDVGTVTDVDGRYSLENVPAGTHDLQVRLIGYATKTVVGVEVTAGRVTVVDIAVPTQAVELQELTVSVADERGTAAAVLENRRTAAAVTDAIGREQISDSPDSDAASAMARVPGVSIVDNKFVYVRGLGERYGSTTLDGAVMPSPIADRKAVPLDLVPASFIENVSTSKSYLPDQPADYAGGLVQIRTRRVPGQNFFKIGVGAGFDTETTGKTGLGYAGGGLDFLGFDDGTRDLPALVPRDRAINATNFTPAELEAIGESFNSRWAGVPDKLPFAGKGDAALATEIPIGSKDLGLFATAHWDDSWNRRADYYERVFTTSGIADPEVDYDGRLSSHDVTLGGLLNADIALSPGHRLTFSGLLNRITQDEARILQGFNLDSNADQRNTRIRYVENSLFQGRLGGKHLFGGTTVEWKGSYSHAGRYEPNTREVLYRASDGVFLWDNFIQSGSVFHQDLSEDAFNGSLDVQIPIALRGQQGTIDIGGAVVRRDRDVLTRRFRFINVGPISDEVRSREPDQIFTPETISPTGFQITEATFRADNYVAGQTTFSGYVMADVELLPRLRFAGGARIENNRQDVDPYDLFTSGAEPLEGASVDDTDLIPGATLTWAATDRMNVRAAGSRTLARPEFRELAPFSFADFAGGYLVIGNPVLRQTRITNLDLRWEWFPRAGAVVAISGFYKKFIDPIEEVVFPSTEFLKSWVNAESADNLGIEVEARSGLGFLTEGLENFGLNLNLTLVDSEVHTGSDAQIFVPGVGSIDIEVPDKTRRLQGQSAYVVNVGANWHNPATGSAVTVLYNRFGRRISQIGSSFLADVFEEPHDQLDVVLQQGIGPRLSVKASAENVLGSEHLFTQSGDPLRGRRPGRAFSLKLTWQPVGSS